MNAVANSNQPRQQHANQWVLVDARMRLLSLGNTLYRGISPRGVLDPTARHVLGPRLRAATADGIERTDTASYDGMTWYVQVMPVLGPVLRQPLAVLGCYGRDAATFPEPPLVGSWEWEVRPPGEGQQMRTYWSDSLFDVYGIPRPEARSSDTKFWQAPQWLDELIADGDRAAMRALLDEFLTTTSDGLFLHTYNVRNPSTNEFHRLRFAGRSYVTEPGPPRWFRGISCRIDHIDPPAHSTPGTHEFLNAAFALTDVPLCAIDTVYEHIYMTTQNFAELGLWLPPHRHLPTMCHPDDLHQLRCFLKDALSHPSAAAEPVQARFATADGDWRTLTISGAGVRLSNVDDPHHVLCRVQLAQN